MINAFEREKNAVTQMMSSVNNLDFILIKLIFHKQDGVGWLGHCNS